MKRRSFLAKSTAAIAAIGVLGLSVKPERIVLYGDGVHDDTAAIQAFLDGKEVFKVTGERVRDVLSGGVYKVSETIHFRYTPPKTISDCRIDSYVTDGATIQGDSPATYGQHLVRDIYVKCGLGRPNVIVVSGNNV